MSVELESGLVVKTFPTRLVGYHMVRLAGLHGTTAVPMEDAVSQIEAVFDLEEIQADQGIRKIMPTLLSHNPTLVDDYEISFEAGQRESSSAECLRPFVQVELVTPKDFDASQVQFLGEDMDRVDFLLLTYYILSNTAIEGDNDPRLGLLERLREKYTDIN